MSGKVEQAVENGKGGILLRMRVQPRASRERMVWSEDGRLRVSVTAPPVDDAANNAVRACLAKALGVARRDVTILSGEQSRNKTVHVANISVQEAQQRLNRLL